MCTVADHKRSVHQISLSFRMSDFIMSFGDLMADTSTIFLPVCRALENPDAYFWKISEYPIISAVVVAHIDNFHLAAAPMVVGFFIIFCSSYIKNAFATAGRVFSRKRREDMVMRYERDEKNRLYRRD